MKPEVCRKVRTAWCVTALTIGFGTAILGLAAPGTAQAGIVAFWNFSENGGTTLGDVSSNNLSGTIYGSPSWVAGHLGGTYGDYALQFTGNPAQYALGSLASGSSDELAQWISERQAQNYDAVFVDTGAEVALHIDRELPIDFEPHGRKLAYARKQRGNAHYVAALD